jgi:hypothetical protein
MSISWENAVETQEFTANPIINNKIKAVVAGLPRSIANLFLEFPDDHNKELVTDFLQACIMQENISLNTKRVYLIALAYLARWAKKPLETITADELYDYLNSFQPQEESKEEEKNHEQSWINTQKTLCRPLQKFFKWLAYPKLTVQERKRLPREKWPLVLKRFELQTKPAGSPRTPVKDSERWKEKDVAIFLKYCTDNPRLRLYHAMAWETSATPGELLQLKIGDIEDNIQLDEDGAPLAVFEVGRYGKTPYRLRHVGITKLSLQYYNRYLPTHPDSTNKKAYLFASLEYSALGRDLPITVESLRKQYIAFRDKVISKLVNKKERPDIPAEEDRKHLQFLKDTKRWHPYIMRHSSLDMFADDPNVNDHSLRRHAGWSKRSNMVEIYTSRRGSGVENVMMALGVKVKSGKQKLSEELKQQMVGPVCPFCLTSNIPGTQLCISCHKPVSLVSINKLMEEDKEKAQELKQLRQEQRKVMEVIKLMKSQQEQVLNYLRAQNAVFREANAEMEKNMTKEEIEQIDKELQEEEDEQAARDGIDMNELLYRKLLSSTKKT